ncbi:DNA ligase [Aureococcus anophagefferens]|nr:DNA ligase [Aureococcus anophagefferens]
MDAFLAKAKSPKKTTNNAHAKWTCGTCTYTHDGGEAGFLCCAMCGAQRVAPAPPSSPRADDTVRRRRTPDDVAKDVDAFDPARGLATLTTERNRPAYGVVARCLDAVSATRSRLAKDRALTNALRWAAAAGGADDLAACCYLLAPTKDAQTGGHRLRPDYAAGPPLGLSRHAVVEAAAAAAAPPAALAAARKAHGSLGDAVVALRDAPSAAAKFFKKAAPSPARPPPPAAAAVDVLEALKALGEPSGPGSERAKTDGMARLVRASRGTEAKWLLRTFVPHMESGISLEAAVVPALAKACLIRACGAKKCPPKARDRVARAARGAFSRRGDVQGRTRERNSQLQRLLSRSFSTRDVRVLAAALLGVAETETAAFCDALDAALEVACRLEPGVPPAPMLANAVTSEKDAIAKLRKYAAPAGAAALEHKYDGQRAQLHGSDGALRIFSRKNDDMTDKYPDVARAARAACAQTFVVDAEIVPVSAAANPLAFQALGARKRVGVTEANVEQAVRLVLFDLLWLGDADVTALPLSERRAKLRAAFGEPSAAVAYAASTDVDLAADDAPLEEAVTAALLESVDAGCEGLMLKRLDAPYEYSLGSKRSDAWVKLKKDYVDALGDSLDLVVIGGWQGQGRKSKWVSPILVATRDPETEALGSVCRVMSGFTDVFYKDFTVRALGAEIGADAPAGDEPVLLRDAPAPGVDTGERCLFWFEPRLVWEIRGADLSISPTHRAARPDKTVEMACTPGELAAKYRDQNQGQGGGAGPRAAERDDGGADG